MEARQPTTTMNYLILAALAAWGLVGGYFRVLSFFAPYDDEGNLMLSTRDFIAGRILYDEVYSPYGPVYYLYKKVFFDLTGLAVTHNVTRLTTLAVWVLVAVGCALLIFRLSRSRVFSAIGFVLTFIVLGRTVHEPGLPQDICALIEIGGLLLLTATNKRTLKLCILAALIGLLLLVKVNLGVFFGLAILIALVTATNGRLARVLQVLSILAAIALPLLLFGKYLHMGWLGLYLGIVAGFTGLWLMDRNGDLPERDVAYTKYFWMAGTFATVVTAIVLITMALGTTFFGVLYGTVLQNFKMGGDFVQTFPSWWFIAPWAVGGAIAAGLFYLLKVRAPNLARQAAVTLQIGLGVSVVVCSLAGYSYFLNEMLLMNFATPFLWIGLIGGKEMMSSERLARVGLVGAALLLTLQVFPIAGTQRAYSSILMVVIGVISLHDGLKSLDGLSEQFSQIRSRFGLPLGLATAVLLSGFAAFWALEGRAKYWSNTPLALPGAELVRLPEDEAANFRSLASKISENCDHFITMPSLDSLYFWTEQNSPTTLNATAWVSMLDEKQQASIVKSFEPLPRRCAIYHPQLTLNGSRNRNIAQSPLVKYIFENFTTVSTVGEYQFMLSNDRTSENER